jgi:hypothetical protein
MNVKSPTRDTLMRLLPPLTVWAIGKIFEVPSVKGNVMEWDGRANKKRYELTRSVKRGVKNAKSNLSWLVAGAAAVVIGVGLIAKSARD